MAFTAPPRKADSRTRWRDLFGTSKEDGKPQQAQGPGRSLVSTDTATVRLLQALRSMAPGGWSDDRWEQSRHFLGITYVAIHRLSTLFGQAEFQVFRKDRHAVDGKVPVQEGEPGYDLITLLEKPNKQDNFGKLMYRWSQQKRLTGMALTWMVPNALGTPMELYSIPTALAIPQPAVNPEYPDGYYRIQPVYPYGPFSTYPTPAAAVGAVVPAQWMLRFLYPHPILRYEGYSPLTGMRQHIDQHEMMDRSRWYSMKRSIKPSAVLNMEEMEGAQPLPDHEIERIRVDFENTVQGAENVGQLFVASPGAKLEPWGTNPVDMDYTGGWEQVASFILGGGFGITKEAAGMINEASYAALFATLKQLHILTLQPECDDLASDLTRHLAPHFGDDLIVEIRCRRIDDHDVKNAKLEILMKGMALTKGELRKEMDMAPFGDERDNEIAGVPDQASAEVQQGPGGLEGLPGSESNGKDESKKDETEQAKLEKQAEPEIITQSRPKPGNLGRGALGPRDSKSFYARTRKVLLNGHAK